MTRHQSGISALVSQTSFGGETSGSVAKCWLFSQATLSSPFLICFLCFDTVSRCLYLHGLTVSLCALSRQKKFRFVKEKAPTSATRHTPFYESSFFLEGPPCLVKVLNKTLVALAH